MNKTSVHAEGVSRPSSPYSQALVVEARRTLYVSGQVPTDEDGTLVGKGDIEIQTRKVIGNIQALCQAEGGGLDNIVFWTIYLTDIRYRPVVTKVRSELLTEPYPATTMVQVGGLADENWLIEIDAIVALE